MAKHSKAASNKKTSYRLQESMTEFIREKRIAGKSSHTLDEYSNTQKKFAQYFTENPLVRELTREDWLKFFEWLRISYCFRSGSKKIGRQRHLSAKSLLNVHTNVSSFYTWMAKVHMVDYNLIRTIEMTRPADPMIDPLTVEEIRLLLDACEKTAPQKGRGERYARPTAKRDRAIILLLADTGIRVSELCDAQIEHLDLVKRMLIVRGKSRGGKTKLRAVPLGKRTAMAINAYHRERMQERKMPLDDKDFVFAQKNNDTKEMNRGAVLKLLVRLGKKSGVKKVHPHRFRHFFSIELLRGGATIYALQEILGHETLDTIRAYLKIAQADIRKVHGESGPVDKHKL